MEKQLTFKNRQEFRKWLEVNHDSHEAIWLVFGKKGGPITLHPDEALHEALCFGWIDGLLKKIDDLSYKKRFSHRNKTSIWSERNKGFVKILIENGTMTEFGLEEIRRAKKNGKWFSNDNKTITQEQINILIKNIDKIEPALSNFIKMTPSVQKTYTMHYLSAKKEETRKRRLLKIIDRLNNNLKPM